MYTLPSLRITHTAWGVQLFMPMIWYMMAVSLAVMGSASQCLPKENMCTL